jgi:photosystem II stability/assembly factor-like uncharacterized protein
MRTRWLALICGAIVLTGCGSAPAPPAARPVSRTCQSDPWFYISSAGSLDGIQFVSAGRGWAVGQHTILATTNGGRHWSTQLSGQLNLTSVDFISASVGWAVGTDTLLVTSDGGAHWASLPEPGSCLPIRSVHFISSRTGFAVAGGREIADFGPEVPGTGGVVLATGDGGRTWRALAGPADAQTVCFDDPRDGWLGAGGRLYRTTDGGRNWTRVTAGMQPSSDGGYPAAMLVQCAGAGSAWALDVGLGAQMSKQPQVAYHAGPAGAVPVFAGQFFLHLGIHVTAGPPGGYAGPFSAISPSAAAFVGWCPGCGGVGTASWDLATDSGASLVREGNVGWQIEPDAASFLSPRLGWVTGTTSYSGNGVFRQSIVFTDDSGRTWHLQYMSPAA